LATLWLHPTQRAVDKIPYNKTMKKISLTQGKIALINDEDFLMVHGFKWHAIECGRTYYAARQGPRQKGKKRKTFLMHRVLMNASKNQMIDHADGDGLNNQKNNLRFCTFAENMRNSKRRIKNISGYKGVSFYEKIKKWSAKITVNYKLIYLGCYKSKHLAGVVYNIAALKYHGQFAKINKISA